MSAGAAGPRVERGPGISSNLAGVAGSDTLRMTALAAELRARGVSIVALSAGEPDFPTPPHVRAAGELAIERGHTRYTAVGGIPELRAAIAEKLTRESGIPTEARDVLVTAGAKQALYNACVALFGPGDEVLVPAPYWVSFPAMVRLARATPVVVETTRESGYKVAPDDLRRALTPRTRGLILNSPSNPTGAVYDEAELAALGELCAERGLWVLADEIYEKLCYERPAAPSFAAAAAAARARTITVNGFSKTYAMTGWRLGYAAGPRAAIAAMEVLQSHSTSNASSVSQHAALAALVERAASERALAGMRAAFRERRDRLVAGLAGLAGVATAVPQGAFYVWSDVRGLLAARGVPGSDALCERLLAERGLALVAGSAFGAEGHVRWSFAASLEEIEEGLSRFRGWISGERPAEDARARG